MPGSDENDGSGNPPRTGSSTTGAVYGPPTPIPTVGSATADVSEIDEARHPRVSRLRGPPRPPHPRLQEPLHPAESTGLPDATAGTPAAGDSYRRAAPSPIPAPSPNPDPAV